MYEYSYLEQKINIDINIIYFGCGLQIFQNKVGIFVYGGTFMINPI